MKFLCSACNRLLDVERFRLEGSSLVVTCPACGAESRANHSGTAPAPHAMTPLAPPLPSNVTALRTPTVEAVSRAAAAATTHAFDVPEGHCPKCISKRAAEALACPSCGLVFAQAKENGFDPSDWLKTEWLALLSAWGDDPKHEALRAAAMDRGELAQVGRLYRLRLAELPDDPYAQRGRDEVLRLAVLPHTAGRALKADPETPTWKYVALSAVIVACLIALFLLVRQMLTVS